MAHYQIQSASGHVFYACEAPSAQRAWERMVAEVGDVDLETERVRAGWIIREVPAPVTLDDALDGWHKQQGLEHETAQDFADAFLASPDADNLAGDPSIMDIECACRARWDWLRACADGG